MAFRSSDLYARKNDGWGEDFSTDHKKTYTPKNSGELLKINYFTIDKVESKFTCSISTEKSYRANQIADMYIVGGGSKNCIYDMISGIKVFKDINAEEVGLILNAISTFHQFDKNSKESLLKFIGLSDFPNHIEHKSTCTIS